MKRALLFKSILLLVLIASAYSLKAQNLEEDTVKRDSTIKQATRPRTVYLEAGGPGLALTINYDTRFGNDRDKWGYHIGAGYYNTGANWVATVPMQVNYLYGSGSSFLELGAGTTFVRSQGSTKGSFFEF